MKRLFLSITLFFIASFISCTKDKIDLINDQERDLSVSAVKAWFKKPSKVTTNARISKNRFQELEPVWKLAKEQMTKAGNKCLEIPLKYPSETRWMSNLGTDGKEELQINPPKLTMVVYLQNGKRVATIKEVRPSIEYDRKYRGRIIKESFSGKLLVWSWGGDLIGGSFYEDGKRLGSIVPVSGDKTGRTNVVVCEVINECHWSSICFEFPGPGGQGNPPILYGTQTYGRNTTCNVPDYGHGDGMANCTNWEFTASYTYTECYNTPDPGNPGDPGDGEGSGPGEVDTFFGFPSNPVDGQKFTYVNPSGNRTTFTWYAQCRVWMLPELTALRSAGYAMNFEAPISSFEGAIATSVFIAAVEPSQIGKVILVGAGIVLTLYVVWQSDYIPYLNTNPHRDQCIEDYEDCVGSGNDCSTCLHNCVVQGSWPNWMCP